MRRNTILFIIVALLLAVSVGCGCDACACRHEFSDWSVANGTACEGQTLTRKCNKCDFEEFSFKEGAGHSYQTATKVLPTCASDGYEISTCEVCNHSASKVLTKLEHNLVTSVREADCTSPKKQISSCSQCDYVEEIVIGEKLEHNYELVAKMYVTCLKPYVNKLKCTLCENEIYENSAEVAPHVYQLEDYLSPTCTQDGYELKKCAYCDDEINVILDKTEHDLITTAVNSTCLKEGYIIAYCQNPACGYSDVLMNLPKAPHVMTVAEAGEIKSYYSYDGISIYSDVECKSLVTSSDCFVFPQKNYHFKCESADCGLTTSAGAHQIVNKKTATCTKPGENIDYCKSCGYIKASVPIPANGHDSSGVTHFCLVDYALTFEYHKLTGDISNSVCYKCSVCCDYVLATPHNLSCPDEEVSCLKAQYCLECNTVTKAGNHVMPEFTCVSTNGDGYYYCQVCKIHKLGEVTPHNVPDGFTPCKVSELLSQQYFLLTGEEMDVSYICADCQTYVKPTDHDKSCPDDQVTCSNPQVCTQCGVLLKSVSHEAPEIKCVSSRGDDSYYCKNCNQYPMGKLISHDFTYAVDEIPATCTTNQRTLGKCRCGLEDSQYVERAGTMLGHKIDAFVINDVKDCVLGHVMIAYKPYCQHEGCSLNFSDLVDQNNWVYCLSVYNYFNKNGYLDQPLFDQNVGRAGDKLVKSMITCCQSTSNRYNPEEHSYSNLPYTTDDLTIDGVLYKYVPSTCTTKGSAVMRCTKCYQLSYIENCLDLDGDNHQSELLACNEHCSDCMPEGMLCNLSMEIVVYDQNGNKIASEVLGGNFLSTRVIEQESSGEKVYVLTDAYVSTLEGLEYFTSQQAAVDQNYKYEMDWESVILRPDQDNVFIVYKRV